jgi:hypothetical protein
VLGAWPPTHTVLWQRGIAWGWRYVQSTEGFVRGSWQHWIGLAWRLSSVSWIMVIILLNLRGSSGATIQSNRLSFGLVLRSCWDNLSLCTGFGRYFSSHVFIGIPITAVEMFPSSFFSKMIFPWWLPGPSLWDPAALLLNQISKKLNFPASTWASLQIAT